MAAIFLGQRQLAQFQDPVKSLSRDRMQLPGTLQREIPILSGVDIHRAVLGTYGYHVSEFCQIRCLQAGEQLFPSAVFFTFCYREFAFFRIYDLKIVKILRHPVIEISLGMQGWIFFLIQLHADIAAGFFHMTTAGADPLREVIRQFTGINFPDTASDREFISAAILIVDHAGIHSCHLEQEITDQSQHVRITRLGMDHSELVIVIVIAA